MQASVDKNAKEIKVYIEEIYWGSGKRVLLLWHSKGRVDSAAVLSMYWNELKGKVASLALAQSPYRGSPIASDILREGRLGDYVNILLLKQLIICFANTLFNVDVCQDSSYQNLTPETLKRVHEYYFDHPETSKAFSLQQPAPLPERAFLGDIYRNLMAN
ncbi:alpha/beta-Hydrolases superfamily protein [Abeliophyllum distichum]|uniref:Alpha/beta-Hydrolases superfamily protein n=1 Tax=Abeliophyllum distichum TaxID=126358 RepID=A0ABD1T2S4_9LAMI